MCIAIAKPMGADLPSESILRNCFENNPDGAGFSYAIGGNVFIRKGYMTFPAFIEALKTLAAKYDTKKMGMLLHFRIATHGNRDASMTHPFPIQSDDGALQKIEYVSNYSVIHNGIISLTSYEAGKASGLSDTAVFIKKYLTDIASNEGWFYNPANWTLIYNLIGSKMAILSATGEIGMTPGFTEDNGIWYSNSSYKENYVKHSYSYYPKYLKTSENWDKSKNYKDTYTPTNYVPVMVIPVNSVMDGDFGTEVVEYEDTYYMTAPDKDGLSDIYMRHPMEKSAYKYLDSAYAESYEEYFSDYEYVGRADVYDSAVKPIEFRTSNYIYEDQILSDYEEDEPEQEGLEIITTTAKQ